MNLPRVNPIRELSLKRYQLALIRIMHRLVVDEMPLYFFDITDIGAKETVCSWGFCSDDIAQWPDWVDHRFPQDFVNRGRVVPLCHDKELRCPLDRWDEHPKFEGNQWSGCFWRCRVFSSADLAAVDRKEAYSLYAKYLTGTMFMDKLGNVEGTTKLGAIMRKCKELIGIKR